METTFKYTPKPRLMNNEENNKFDLLWDDGTPIHPKWLTTGNVWISGDNGKLPVYAFYCCGTNCLKIFKYSWYADKWEEVKLENIDMYGILWKNLVKIKEISDWDNLI